MQSAQIKQTAFQIKQTAYTEAALPTGTEHEVQYGHRYFATGPQTK
jgi:hypothetical protein